MGLDRKLAIFKVNCILFRFAQPNRKQPYIQTQKILNDI